MGSCSTGGSLSKFPFFKSFRGLPYLFAGFLESLLCIIHAFQVFWLLHSILKFIGISKNALFFVSESFYLLQEFFFLFLVFCRFKGGLKFFQFLVDISLATCEFFKSIQYLPHFLLLWILGCGLCSFCFVAVVFFF